MKIEEKTYMILRKKNLRNKEKFCRFSTVFREKTGKKSTFF
ncbi:hypothetical protein [Phascolarctobacterium succinatutens]